MPNRDAYHHGDLRRTLLAAARDLIAERGVGAVSLRELARRAGVSHAAPAHHFTDKAGLFTALAVEGYGLLGDTLAAASADAGAPPAPDPGGGLALLRELGVRYVRFALAHPAHFDVMFRPELCRETAELAAARDRTERLLRAAVPGGPTGPRAEVYSLAAWSAAHGFATLWRDGSLSPDRDGADPEELFLAAADTLFAPAPAGP
jgi:AcrR family transcriptional regulator